MANSIAGSSSVVAERAGDPSKTKLPSRDYIILPLLSLATIAVMFGTAELLTRVIWVEQERDTCRAQDPVTGPYHLPNCVTRIKAAESPWVEEKFNDCGYRTPEPCRVKQPNTLRVALMGSSMTEGYLIPYEETFAARAAEALTRACRKRVEFQNMGVVGFTPIYAYRRLDEALRIHPDVVMLAVTSFDIEHPIDPEVLASRKESRTMPIPTPSAVKLGMGHKLKDTFSQSRTLLVAQHFLYENEQTYAKLFLLDAEHAAFLQARSTPGWDKRFADLDLLLEEMADKLRTLNIPFVVASIPHRAAIAMLTSHNVPPGIDPNSFDNRVEQICSRHRIVYVDLNRQFSQLRTSNGLYYPENSHMNSTGEAVIGDAIIARFLDGSIPAFAACRRSERNDAASK